MGQGIEGATFLDVTLWGCTAEAANQYLIVVAERLQLLGAKNGA